MEYLGIRTDLNVFQFVDKGLLTYLITLDASSRSDN